MDQAEGIYVSSDLASIEKEKKKKELNKKRGNYSQLEGIESLNFPYFLAQENKLKRAREPKMNKWKKRKLERKKRKLEHNDNELENKTISSETKPAPVTPKVQLEKKDRNSPKKKDPNLKQRAKDRNLKKGAQKGKLKEKNHTKAD